MSRILRAWPLGLLLVTNGIAAQEVGNDARPTVTAQQVFDTTRDAYGPPAPEPDCEPQQGEEIIVCAEEPEDPDRFRIGSALDGGDDSHLSKDIRAPDFAPPPCVPSLLTLCPKFGAPPPSAYIVDFSALPEAPAGSDAERVGQGLAPRISDSPITEPGETPDENSEPQR